MLFPRAKVSAGLSLNRNASHESSGIHPARDELRPFYETGVIRRVVSLIRAPSPAKGNSLCRATSASAPR